MCSAASWDSAAEPGEAWARGGGDDATLEEAAMGDEGPPPQPAAPVLAILCDGQRLESGPLDNLEGFRTRARESFFQCLLDPEADQFKDSTGALVITDMPLALVRDVWRYLTEGLQPSLGSLSEYCDWRRVCDFFALAVPDPLADVRRCEEVDRIRPEASAYATHRYLMVRAACAKSLSPLCYSLRCGSACCPQAVPLGFDQVCFDGTHQLQALHSEPPLEVKLEPLRGALSLRFMREALWQNVGGHPLLRQKRLIALKVRFPRQRSNAGSQPELQVAELYLHVSPGGLRGKDVCIAAWPSFWCLVRVVRQRALGHAAWSSWNATFEVLPGAICLMAGDLVVQVVAQPRSLRKCYLRVCGGDLEHEVRAKLVAPAPFSTPHARSGKGKASFPGKGVGPSLIAGQKYYKYQVPSYDTPTPEDAARNVVGRCMQQVWVVCRRSGPNSPPHVVVLLHAADGRVAIAQLSGVNGCIPPLYGAAPPLYGAAGSGGPSRKTCAIWGAKAWHWGQHGGGAVGQYRRSYDVPKCHEVMGVALEDTNRILVLHRPRARGSPQIWTVSQPQELRTGSITASSFFRVHGRGKGAGGKNKGGKGNSIGPLVGGSWADDRWGTADARQAVLPDDLIEDLDLRTTAAACVGGAPAEGTAAAGWPLLVPLWKGSEASAPEVEVLRLAGAVDVHERPHRQDAPQRRPYAPHPVGAGAPDGCRGNLGAQATWQITGRLHYRCQEPTVPH